MTHKPFILGMEGVTLTQQETELFQKHPPKGYILFKRNCHTPHQILELTASLRQISGSDCPILIDQEGGRVSRLKEPTFQEFPAPATFKTPDAVYQNARNMARQLAELGITVNCTPLADLVFDSTHAVIGDRSFGSDPHHVGLMAANVIQGHFDAHITPIIKHIPGHGRALVDSHETCPRVDTPLETLASTDFEAFIQTQSNLSPLQQENLWAMTAHIIYTDIDPLHCATQSKIVIQDIIRKTIHFKGTLISDCITMKALEGTMVERAQACFEAGCDLVLHCSGDFTEMQALLSSH
ncbi:MAG: glycoside hydrolase family 3 protein [Alphaproteobacteria bacterium]|nr:glycoside hydrolase family 3 protein [Alphaproteobacteria bacterium]